MVNFFCSIFHLEEAETRLNSCANFELFAASASWDIRQNPIKSSVRAPSPLIIIVVIHLCFPIKNIFSSSFYRPCVDVRVVFKSPCSTATFPRECHSKARLCRSMWHTAEPTKVSELPLHVLKKRDFRNMLCLYSAWPLFAITVDSQRETSSAIFFFPTHLQCRTSVWYKLKNAIEIARF